MTRASVAGVRRAAQRGPSTCGPAALAAALSGLGVEADEDELAALAGTGDEGTEPSGLVEAAWRAGAIAREVEAATLDDLRGAMLRGQVAIVALQAPDDEAGAWTAGHYVVPVAIGGGRVIVADPAEGRDVEMSEDEFVSRWHDAHGGALHVGAAVIVRARP